MPLTASHSSRKKIEPIQPTGLVGSISRFWHRSYAGDYVGFILLLVGYILVQFITEPFHRMFSLDDLAISFPHAEVERVPTSYNILYSGLLPLVLLLLLTTLIFPSERSPTNRFHKPHITILGLLISLLLTSFLTDLFKNVVGRPRPDLLARCKPVKKPPTSRLVTWEICTEKAHHTLHDGWRSFPSGHSSFAFAGLGYLSFFLAGQLHVFRPKTEFASVLLPLAPLIGAAMIAVSRLEDYRHDFYDVSAGSLLGVSLAYFSYRRYYPSLQSRRCHEPYPSRAETGAAEKKQGQTLDEEERVGGLDDDEDGERDGDEHTPLRAASLKRGRGRSHSD